MSKYEREIRKCAEFRAAEGGEEYIVEGYATTFGDTYTLYSDGAYELREVVEPQAFDKCDMSDVIMQYDHTGRVFARNRNNTLILDADEHGLRIKARLGGTEIGRQLFEEIQGGYTNKMSFGFTVAGEKKTRSKAEDGHITILRTITKIGKLYDVSAVSLPANDATEISARSTGDGLIAEAMKEVQAEEERARKIGEIRKILKGEQNHDE